MKKYCINCNIEIENNKRFCPECGLPASSEEEYLLQKELEDEMDDSSCEDPSKSKCEGYSFKELTEFLSRANDEDCEQDCDADCDEDIPSDVNLKGIAKKAAITIGVLGASAILIRKLLKKR
jgi:hypothetical protein